MAAVNSAELEPIPWDKIELDYRAGVLSVRAIARKFGVSHTAIQKRAREEGWTRDLAPAIRQRSDEMLARSAGSVATNDVAGRVATRIVQAGEGTVEINAELLTVELNAEILTTIRAGHRKAALDARRLAEHLFAELSLAAGPDAAEIAAKLEGVLDDPDEPKLQALEDAVALMASLPARMRVLKDYADVLTRFVALEREAYGLNTVEGGERPTAIVKDYTGRGDPDNLPRSDLQ